MSEQRTEHQGQGSAFVSREQIELIGVVFEPLLAKVVADMRLVIKEEVEQVRVEMKEEVEKVRVEMKDEVRQQIQTQSKHFHWVIGVLVTIWLAVAGAVAGIVANKWPQAAAVAPAVPVAQVAPVSSDLSESPDLSQPPDLNEPPDLSQP